MKLDKQSYEKYFRGYFLTDCVVRARDIFYFILQEDEKEESSAPLTRIVSCIKREGIQPWGYAQLRGMHRLMAGVSIVPKEQFIGVSHNDHVYALGSGEKGLEDDLQGGRAATGKDIGMRGALAKLRTIGGELWLTGSGRTVGRRLGKSQWEWHDVIPYKSLMDDGGFNDIDGFSENDIYAAGGHGDVWHFDGSIWKQLPFPSNMTLEAICCAGDGEVYIGAESGTVFKGRNNKWKMISRGEMSLPFRDMVWHQGKVWCTSDYGLWVIEKDKVNPADVPAGVTVCAGHLSVRDGVMLLAGMYGAALHNGEGWERIIDYNDFV
jgi:hypothetical protein